MDPLSLFSSSPLFSPSFSSKLVLAAHALAAYAFVVRALTTFLEACAWAAVYQKLEFTWFCLVLPAFSQRFAALKTFACSPLKAKLELTKTPKLCVTEPPSSRRQPRLLSEIGLRGHKMRRKRTKARGVTRQTTSRNDKISGKKEAKEAGKQTKKDPIS